VAQSQVLQHELPARLEGCPETSQDGNDYAKHGPPNMTDEAGGSTTSIDDKVFATHRCHLSRRDFASAAGSQVTSPALRRRLERIVERAKRQERTEPKPAEPAKPDCIDID